MSLLGRHHGDEQPAPPPSHAPTEDNTLTVQCAQTGTVEDPDGAPINCPTIADIEAWCAELRKHGASGDLAIRDAVDCLNVTLDLS